SGARLCLLVLVAAEPHRVLHTVRVPAGAARLPRTRRLDALASAQQPPARPGRRRLRAGNHRGGVQGLASVVQSRAVSTGPRCGLLMRQVTRVKLPVLWLWLAMWLNTLTKLQIRTLLLNG